MFESNAARLATIRSVAAWTIATVAIGGVIGAWMYGPYFTITNVQVDGTTVVRPDTVKAWVEHDIHRLRWFVLPQDHSVLLSTSQLSNRLHAAINKRLSVEMVTVTIPDRHSLHINIIERQAMLVWKSGEQRVTVDRHGVVIGPVDATAATNLPVVEDQTLLPTATDDAMLSPEVVKGFTTLDELARSIGLTVDRYILPIPRCVVAPEPSTTNANTNSGTQNSNTEKNSTNSTNTTSAKNTNEKSGVEMTIDTCQNATARFNASDMWLQVSKGPVIYFDRHNDLHQAMDAVRRALEDTKNRTARYIDARFPGRIYVQ
jgi:hypothetical protein